MLDVGTGTGEIALRAARRGADVTGIDIAPALLDLARAKPDADKVHFEVADAQALPFADGSFDAVASNFGVIFAPDREAAAGELARVCRGGGRLALTAWCRGSTIGELLRPFGRTSSVDVEAWSEQPELERLLGDAFELELRERVWEFESESGEAAFDFFVRTAPPMKAFFDSLEDERHAGARAALVAYWEGFRDGDRVREPRRYVLVLGRRR